MSVAIKQNINLFFDSLGKMSPGNLIRNPMMFLVWIAALLATSITAKEYYLGTSSIWLYVQMTFWLWMTVYFSCLADSMAEAKVPKNLESSIVATSTLLVKKIFSKSDFKADLKKYKLVPSNRIKAGTLLLLHSGDEVPFDGEVIAGKCYVYEADITGEVGDVLKSPDHDSILIKGSDLIGEDEWLVMKVSFARRKSFILNLMTRLEKIRRQSMPSELALQRLILGLSVLFVTVIFTVAVIAEYSGVTIPFIYLLDLVVILLPTTISGLQSSVILFAKTKLAARDEIIVQDHVALDNVVDVNIALIDKTGTLTIGLREMTDFTLVDEHYHKKYLEYLYLSSVQDNTHEGKSIVEFTKGHSVDKLEFDEEKYNYTPFGSANAISGCNYKGYEIRKGSAKSIAKYLGLKLTDLPDKVVETTMKVAEAHGTPLLFAVNKKIIGVVHLRDRFRRGVMKQLARLRDEGVALHMVTGDNAMTASYMAKKLGMDEYHADCTPEKKLSVIKDLQRKGYVVAMCGDGINDALAMAQANIGIIFSSDGKVSPLMRGNIISKKHDISALLNLKSMCRKMTAKRGALTVFSLSSDVAKYFVIVPALFTTAFPPLSVMNFMRFNSLESVILASVMFNSLIIFFLTPFVFNDSAARSKRALWKNIMLFGVGGIISPFIGIKILDVLIEYVGLL